MRLAYAIIALGGCGRFNFDERPPGSSDGGGDAPVLHLDAGECPPSYTHLATGCYRIETATDMFWMESELACEQDAVGAHLVVIDTLAEANAIAPFAVISNEWIGVTDLATPGVFLTVVGTSPSYLVWQPMEPMPSPSDCVMFENGTLESWTDFCDSPEDRLCEYDGIPAVHSAWGQ